MGRFGATPLLYLSAEQRSMTVALIWRAEQGEGRAGGVGLRLR